MLVGEHDLQGTALKYLSIPLFIPVSFKICPFCDEVRGSCLKAPPLIRPAEEPASRLPNANHESMKPEQADTACAEPNERLHRARARHRGAE
jgi:hypothetical protein